MGQTTGGLTSIDFLEALRTAFPAFAKKGKSGHYGQHDAEEWYSHIISQLKQNQRINLGGQCYSSYDSFIDNYLSGQMVSTLRCEEEARDKLPTEIVETFVHLNCHISSSISRLRDGLLAGLTVAISKHSPSLDRCASDTKTGRITRLPIYLTCLFVRVHWNREINKQVKCNRKVTFPFELDATEFCAEVLRRKLGRPSRLRTLPASDGLRGLREDAEDRNHNRGHHGNSKWAAANHEDAAGRMVPARGFVVAWSPLAAPADMKEKSEAVVRTKEAEANLGDVKQGLIDELQLHISQDQWGNLSGKYELMGVITHLGTSADSGEYYRNVEKEGDGGLWCCYRTGEVVEVPRERIKTLAEGG
ncbi:hypothetical protein HOY80DRAFT_880544 [Tuber brumale]|nr:hypothetical protein HOY80DRAFT_880544 [Tuber brumale]